MERSWRDGLRTVRRGLAAGLCAALALALFFMAVAVVVQAVAVLTLALLAAVLLLPHPLKWYAEQGGAALGVFLNTLRDSFDAERKNSSEKRDGALQSQGH